MGGMGGRGRMRGMLGDGFFFFQVLSWLELAPGVKPVCERGGLRYSQDGTAVDSRFSFSLSFLSLCFFPVFTGVLALYTGVGGFSNSEFDRAGWGASTGVGFFATLYLTHMWSQWRREGWGGLIPGNLP